MSNITKKSIYFLSDNYTSQKNIGTLERKTWIILSFGPKTSKF